MTTQQTHYFTQENVRAYYLEYDSERAGSFVLLEKVSEDKLVVLDFDCNEKWRTGRAPASD